MNFLSELLTEMFKFFNNIFSLKKSGEEIKHVVNIYDNMNTVLNTTEVERFLILKAHNGGGKIKAGSELYASVLYEDYRLPFKTVKEAYQKLMVDAEYVRMLNDIYINQRCNFISSTMPEGLLKNLYESEGVKYSELYFLYQDKKSFYFCSIATSKDQRMIQTRAQQAVINVAVSNIRNDLKI